MARRRLSASDRYRVWERAGGRCRRCDEKVALEDGHVDHRVPLSRGGADDHRNYQWLCARCNLNKGNRTDREVDTDDAAEYRQLVAAAGLCRYFSERGPCLKPRVRGRFGYCRRHAR